MNKEERRKGSTSSKKGRRSSRKSNASHSSVTVTVGTASEELSQEESKPPERVINYQDELVFIFFSSMLDIVVEEWTNTVPDSPKQSIDPSADDITTKDYRDLKEEDLMVESQIISVTGQEVSFTKRKMKKRRSSDRSRGSSDKKHKKDSVISEDTKKSPRTSITKRKSFERKRQKKTSTDVSMTQTGSSFLDIHSEDKSQFGSELSKEISQDSLGWILKSEHEYVRINFRNGNLYEGPVFGKLMHGNGTFYWADGSIYEGDFVNGFITGKGYLSMPDLSYYIGDFYKGMFHGEGVFVISKTTMIYSGQWRGGRKHGKGWLLYEPGNWYDGEWYEDRRHGAGVRRYKSGAIYEGEWCCGLKKGHGTMRWENNDLYRGAWSNDLMHGHGKYIWKAFLNKSLTFPSVNMYAGAWNNGMRDGMGLIRFGVESGSKMAGVWESNLKHGPGVVICGNGQQIELNPLFLCDKPITFYEDDSYNDKNESGTCSSREKQSLQMIAEKINEKKPNKTVDKKILNNIANNKKFKRGSAKKKRQSSDFNDDDYISCNSVHIPIHAVAEQMDLTYFITIALRKYNEFLEVMPFGSIVFDKSLEKMSSGSCMRTISTSRWNILTNNSFEQSIYNRHATNDQYSLNYSNPKDKHKYATFLQSQIEEKNMRSTLLVYLPKLHKIYYQYATLASSEPIHYKVLIPRIFMWQLWIDIGMRQRGVSLIDIDLILAENRSNGLESVHDPFEKLCFWQFVEAIISMAWFYYEKEDLKQYLKDGMLPTAFKKFFDEVLEPNAGNFSGHALFDFKNLIPIKSTYLLYRTYGEPHTARQFLCNSCVKKEHEPPCYLKVPEKHIKGYRKGINIVPIGSNIVFLPDDPPGVGERPETPKEEQQDPDPFYRTLMTFRRLGPQKIVQCLTTICPNIKEDGVIVNMDYPLSFLEFYETILLCAFAIADEIRSREELIKFKEEMERLEELRRLEEEAAAAAEKERKKSAKTKASKAKMK